MRNSEIDLIEGEIWVDITNWEGLYQVSNKGRVKSVSRYKTIGARGKKLIKGFILKENENRRRKSVILWRSYDDNEKWQVHRLVGMAFIPNPENKPTINHIDGNPSNNSVENLEWATHSEQQLHAVSIGLKEKSLGEKSNLSKTTEDKVRRMRHLFESGAVKTKKELAKQFNLAETTVGFIINRVTWKHI